MDNGTKTGSRSLSAEEILRHARDGAEATRRRYASLAECLFIGRDSELVLSDRQRAILSQMLRQIVGDIDAAVRAAYADLLDDGAGRQRWAPVAADSGSLTYTVMLEKGLLRDLDLIEAVAHRLCQHQLERAQKPADRGRWGDSSEIESPHRFLDLPVQENSVLERRISAYIVDRSRRVDTYGNPVLLPADLEGALIERLYWRVAAVLRGLLAKDFPGDPQRLDALIEAATLDAMRQAQAAASAPASAAEAVAALEAAGLLTNAVLLRLLRAGEIPLFETAIARRTGIRPVLLRRLLYEAGGMAVAVLGRAMDMSHKTVSEIYALTRPAQAGLQGNGVAAVDAIAEVYGGISRDDAESVRAYWARNPAFTHALWEADSGLIFRAAPRPYY